MPFPIRVGLEAGQRFVRHEGTMMAGYVAYSVLLAVFPFLIFCVSLAGLLIGPGQSTEAVDFLFDMVPAHVAQTLEPVLKEVISRSSGSVLTVSALVAIWTSSNGVQAFGAALQRAYEVETPRAFLHAKLVAIAVVLIGCLTFVVLGFAIVFAPLLQRLVETHLEVSMPPGINLLRYVVGIGVLMFFLMILNRWLVRPSARQGSVWPGVIVSGVLWLIGATAFSAYLDYAPSYAVTYGALAGVVITMLFLYLTGIVIIFGAEVNASLVHERRLRDEAGETDHGGTA